MVFKSTHLIIIDTQAVVLIKTELLGYKCTVKKSVTEPPFKENARPIDHDSIIHKIEE